MKVGDVNLDPNGTTPANVTDDGMVVQVPNKVVARLLAAGIHAERESRRRTSRRKAQRLARRRNRS